MRIYIFVLFTLQLVFASRVFYNTCDDACNSGNSNKNKKSQAIYNHLNGAVDVFLMVTKSTQQTYIEKGLFWISPLIIKLLSVNQTMITRIHIFTDSPNTFVNPNHTAFTHPFYLHDINKYKTTTDDFFEVYKKYHYSVNSLPYEFLCFNRWNIYANTMLDWNKNQHYGYFNQSNNHRNRHHRMAPINRILALDLDILMTMDAATFYMNIIHSLSYNKIQNNADDIDNFDDFYELIVVGLGAIHLYSKRGLLAFSNHVINFFNQPVDIIKQTYKNYGPWFSDMMMTKDWVLENNITRNGCFELKLRCLWESIDCIPMNTYNEMIKNNHLLFFQNDQLIHNWKDMTNGTLSIRGVNEKLPYCLIVSNIN
eukprot:gene8356-11303_t